MASWRLSQIARALGCNSPLSASANDPLIRTLATDSRRYFPPHEALFFALSGKNHNGHRYLPELYERGVRAFVVENEEIPSPGAGAVLLKVENSRAALQKLAAAVRTESQATICAITGSNGKTIVKEWLAQLLLPHFKLCRNPGSYNSQIGVPLALWRLEPEHQWGIFEAGLSRPGEMQKLAEMLQPQMGIFTNIGSAHDENFSSRAEKIQEKLRLFRSAQFLVYEKKQSLLSRAIERFAKEHHLTLLSWSCHAPSADLYLPESEMTDHGIRLRGTWQGASLSWQLPFAEKASLQNALHAARAALHAGLSPQQVQEGLQQLQAVEMRQELQQGQDNSLIINDSYNSDLESLQSALQFQQNQAHGRRKIVVLSDMLQSGRPENELYQAIEALLRHYQPAAVYTIGPALLRQAAQWRLPVRSFAHTEALLQALPGENWRLAIILIKGARRFALERLSARLQQKTHAAQLTIYLPRLVHNLNYFRGLLPPKVRIMAMVKAFAYGSGGSELARTLEYHGVDYLGVAYADEGIALRQGGCHLPILVLNAERSAFRQMMHYRLEPEIYDVEQLREWAQIAQSENAEDLPLHLKIETGMHRLGLTLAEAQQAAHFLSLRPGLRIASVFSHLAAADDPTQADFTRQQINRLHQAADQVATITGQHFWRHIANSAGALQYPEARMDMVRLGLSLYGLSANAEHRPNLQVISSFTARVTQLKKLQPGDSVGYGRAFTAPKPCTIATISVGYADGFRRALGEGAGRVAIRGKVYPTVGRICMDMSMVEVTGGAVAVGDVVEIWGDTLNLYDLARQMHTIPYEVLTGISQRVKRIYVAE